MKSQLSRHRSALAASGLLLIACVLLSSPLEAASAKRASELLGEDRYRDALQEVEKVLEHNPEDAGGYYVLARIQFQLTRLTEAQQNFEKAVELDSDYAGIAASYLARLAFFRGEDEECKQHLTRCDAEGWVHHRLSFLMAPPDMNVKKTRHYIVHGDDGLVATGGLTYAAHLMGLIHDSYSKVFPFKMKEKLIHRVYVFSSNDTYAAFNRALIGKDKLGAAGYFSRSTRTLVVNADPRGAEANPQGFTQDAMDTMFHEGFHQFIHMYAPSIPLWFNEGWRSTSGRASMCRRAACGSVLCTRPFRVRATRATRAS